MSADKARGIPIATLIAAGLTRCNRETVLHTMRSMAFDTLLDLGIPVGERFRAGPAKLLDAGSAVQQILFFSRQLRQSG